MKGKGKGIWKKFGALALAAGLVAAAFVPVSARAETGGENQNSATAENADAYVDLSGEWNFKLYRTYTQMFQYHAYFNDAQRFLQWEDNSLALLPSEETFSSWEKFSMPYDNYATGGLLPIERAGATTSAGGTFDPNSVILPKWSEAWVCRTFDLPADFTTEKTATLLMGIIDDCDVIYINGQMVASSGFVDGNGNKTAPGATGGFNYGEKAAASSDEKTASDETDQTSADSVDPASLCRFEKSYWEVEREYKIPTSVLNLGGSNTICVRLYNNNGNGGFYSGHPYAICGNDLAVRKVKGLPADTIQEDAFNKVISQQQQALESGDINAYAATVSDNYHNNAADKEDRLSEIRSLIDGYTDITVTDENPSTYKEGDQYWYNAKRTITGIPTAGGDRATLMSQEIEQCYALENGTMYEKGNWNRCYSTSYSSSLLNKEATYSVYLPPSYYTDKEKNYPVVYLLHGINSSSSSFVNVDKIGDFMDKLIENGKIMEMIVIMPDSGKNSFYRNTEGEVTDSTGPWQDHITKDIIRMADSTYRTIPDSKYRGITGISMGGYGAVMIGTQFPNLFSSVAVHMGYLPQDECLEAIKNMASSDMDFYDFYFDCGLQDSMVDYEDTVAIHEYLTSIGKAHGYDLRNGGHNSAFYMAGMEASMTMHSNHFQKSNTQTTYEFLEGKNQTITKDGKTDLTGKVNAPYSKFLSAEVDGNVLDPSSYTVSSGSTIFTLHASYIQSLAAGTHTLKLNFTDGSTETTFEVKEPQKQEAGKTESAAAVTNTVKSAENTAASSSKTTSQSPKTGDLSEMPLWVLILLIGAGALTLLTIYRRKKKA